MAFNPFAHHIEPAFYIGIVFYIVLITVITGVYIFKFRMYEKTERLNGVKKTLIFPAVSMGILTLYGFFVSYFDSRKGHIPMENPNYVYVALGLLIACVVIILAAMFAFLLYCKNIEK